MWHKTQSIDMSQVFGMCQWHPLTCHRFLACVHGAYALPMASVRQMSCHVILKLPLSLVYLLAFCIKLDVYTFNESLGSDIVGFLVVFTRFFHMWLTEVIVCPFLLWSDPPRSEACLVSGTRCFWHSSTRHLARHPSIDIYMSMRLPIYVYAPLAADYSAVTSRMYVTCVYRACSMWRKVYL